MINIQRNFFIETILLQSNIFNKNDFKELPYKDYITIPENDDLVLIFFDLDRVNNLDAIYKNLSSFKKKSNKLILVPTSKNYKKLEKFINKIDKSNISNLVIINLNKLNIKKIIDVKREKIYKSYLSLDIQLTLSKIIKNLINLLSNNDIRLVSLDLDNTCWSGVIGEDGVKKIYLDEYQKKSLNYLNKLVSKTGLLISFHSKNEKKLGLKGIKIKLSRYRNLVDKSFNYINWNPKIKSIKTILKLVNFSKKNMVYFDDNISEIKQLNKTLINENCLWVKNSYLFFLYTRSVFISNTDKKKNIKRFKDIKSNIKRSEITGSAGILNYVKTSNVKINFDIRKINSNRFIEMSNKTNQFNSNYLRLKKERLQSFYKNDIYKIITFSVLDRYSDSGIISALILEKEKDYHKIIEFLISCRALGRDLELVFINQIIKKFSIKDLRINYKKTDRNEPFIKFAEKIKFKKDKKNYFIDINKIKSLSSKYEKFIKIKIN